MVKSGASEAAVPVVKVWTEPASGYGFLDAAIVSARRSIDLSMYELSDPTIEHDLVARAAAGVDVRVILDADYSGMSENASAYAVLHASKVHVEWAPSNQIFHAKYVGRRRTTRVRRYRQPAVVLLRIDAGTSGSKSRARVTSGPSLVPSTLISLVRT